MKVPTFQLADSGCSALQKLLLLLQLLLVPLLVAVHLLGHLLQLQLEDGSKNESVHTSRHRDGREGRGEGRQEDTHPVVLADPALHGEDFPGLLELLDGLSMCSLQLFQAVQVLLHLG